MKLARVGGTVVQPIQHASLAGHRLLLCDLLDAEGQPSGGSVIALDTVGAGPGEQVLLLDEGTSARQILGLKAGPIRTLVVGIVDEVATAPPAHESPRPR
jgi:ethanolamine utilization protein EutN